MNCLAFNSNLVTVWWYLIGTTYSFRGASPIISFQIKLRFILLDSRAGCENVNWGKQIFADPFWKLLKEPTLPEKKLRQNPEKLITQMVNITCTITQNSWWVIKRCEFDLKETFQRQWQRSGRSGRWERQLSMGGEDGGTGRRTWKWESESEKGKVRKWERQLSMGGEAEGRGTFAHGFHCVCLQTFRHWCISVGWVCVCLVFIKAAHYKNFFSKIFSDEYNGSR